MNVYVYVGVLAYILHECLCVCGCVGLYSTCMFMCMWVCWPIFYMNIYVYVGCVGLYSTFMFMCMWVCWPIFYIYVCVCGCVGLYST